MTHHRDTETDALRAAPGVPSGLRHGAHNRPAAAARPRRAANVVPIRNIGERHRGRILTHLLNLNERDRYLRFGYAATDEQVARYVQSIDFQRDEVYGIFSRRLEMLAMAHLAFPAKPTQAAAAAEFGVSVLEKARGRGYGARLFARATLAARVRGMNTLFIHALSENAAMLRIARNAGARVQREGSESEAYLSLPPAGMDTHMADLVHEQFAHWDYGLKAQAQQWRQWLATWLRPIGQKSGG